MHEVKKMSGLYNCANILMKKNTSLKKKMFEKKLISSSLPYAFIYWKKKLFLINFVHQIKVMSFNNMQMHKKKNLQTLSVSSDYKTSCGATPQKM